MFLLVPAKPQMRKKTKTSRWHLCRSSDAAPEVLCWVQSSCFANMPLRCISVRSVGMAASRHATMKGCCPFRPTDAPLNPEASRRPNAKTSGWRCAPRWLQRPWSRCLGEFHGWGWDKTPVPMQEIHGPWFHRASSASLLDINHQCSAVKVSGGGCGQPLALRGYHLGHGAGHRPHAALCSAADECPAERLLRMCLDVHGEPW